MNNTKKIYLALGLIAAVVAFGASPALAQTALVCTPGVSVTTPGAAVNFFITGGAGPFTISGPGITATTTTSTVFTTSFSSPGAQSFSVTSGGQAATCSVIVAAAGTTPVVCIPPAGAVLVGQSAVFTAAGGTGTFTWSAPDLTISNPNGTTFTASYTTPGIHQVTVRDSAGQAATCSLNVLPTSIGTPAPLICSPSAQSALVGQQVTFNASGGTGIYAWSATDLTITNPAGSTFRATYGTPGLHVVTLTSGTQSTTCSVNVTPVSVPGLPDTGFAPAN